jgi:hypothetical protein
MKQELASKLLRSGEITRRDFAAKTASSLLGVGLLNSFMDQQVLRRLRGLLQAQAGRHREKRHLPLHERWSVPPRYMGSSKEGVETAGPVKPIKTSADGVRLSEYLPLTAQQMHHGPIVNFAHLHSGSARAGQLHDAHQLRAAWHHSSSSDGCMAQCVSRRWQQHPAELRLRRQ